MLSYKVINEQIDIEVEKFVRDIYYKLLNIRSDAEDIYNIINSVYLQYAEYLTDDTLRDILDIIIILLNEIIKMYTDCNYLATINYSSIYKTKNIKNALNKYEKNCGNISNKFSKIITIRNKFDGKSNINIKKLKNKFNSKAEAFRNCF
jgi:hypothetical protein